MTNESLSLSLGITDCKCKFAVSPVKSQSQSQVGKKNWNDLFSQYLFSQLSVSFVCQSASVDITDHLYNITYIYIYIISLYQSSINVSLKSKEIHLGFPMVPSSVSLSASLISLRPPTHSRSRGNSRIGVPSR